MRRSRSLWALSILWVAGIFPAGPLQGQIGLQEVTRVRFQGNQSFTDEALAAAIITRETECRSVLFQIIPFCPAGADFALDPHFFNEREFRRDHARVRLFYYLRGFRETAVDTVVNRPSDEEVRVTFQIQEGEAIRVVDLGFQLMEDLPDSSALQDLPIQVGDPLSLIGLDATRDTLEARLRNRGFAQAEVLMNYLIPRDTPYEAQVSIDVFTGPRTTFGPIAVEIFPNPGRAAKVDPDVVRRMLPFREGELYEEDLQFAGQRNLYNLDIFRGVDIIPDSLSPTDSVLPLTVRVQEGDIRRVRTGGGFSTAECFNFEARWTSRNFMGGARRLQVTTRVANVAAKPLVNPCLGTEVVDMDYRDPTGRVSAEFNQPFFFSTRNSVSASLFAERQSFAPIFVREAVGFGLSLNRTVGFGTLLGLSFRPQRSRLKAAEVIFCSTYLFCSKEEIGSLRERNWLSPLGGSVSLDRRNQPLNPTRGYAVGMDLEYAANWTGSDFSYTRVLSEASWYYTPLFRWVLAVRLRAGRVESRGLRGFDTEPGEAEPVHPEKRLFAGGANSVRGYAQNRLGPQVLYLPEVERLYQDTDKQEAPCTIEEVADLSCDAGTLSDDVFTPSPTGGTRLFEGSVELRFPLAGPRWEGATFMDFGQLWDEKAAPRLGKLDVQFTPGFGVRYFSPIGPIRVDLAYRFGGAQELQVVTKKLEKGPDGEYLPPGELRELAVLAVPVRWGESPGLLRRLQLHVSIGQAF